MLAILSRRPEQLSRSAIIVSLGVPTVLFCAIIGALVFLGMGRITVEHYFTISQFVVIAGAGIFFVLAFTGVGVGAIAEVKEKRPLSVLLYIFALMALAAALPRIFGLV